MKSYCFCCDNDFICTNEIKNQNKQAFFNQVGNYQPIYISQKFFVHYEVLNIIQRYKTKIIIHNAFIQSNQ